MSPHAAIQDLRFTFLGTGTSAGIPIIGCDCDVCRSDDPRDTRMRCSACLQFIDATGQERMILIDASPDLRQQALQHNLQRCDAILFTHNHVDHTFGLDETRRFNVVQNAPIEVHADEHTMKHLHRVYRHIFLRDRNINDSFVATLMPSIIDHREPMSMFGLRITPLRLLHGRLQILGFRIESEDAQGEIANVQPAPFPLAYCTDASAIPPQTWPKLTGLSTLVLDMLRMRHHPTHLTFDQAVDIAGNVDAEATWFIHMSHDIGHATVDAMLPPGMQLAWDGLVLEGAG